MTRSGLIKRLAATNPHLYARDIERIVDTVFDALRQLNADGLTLVLVEQNARRALELADTAFVLEQGAIAHHGKSAALLNDPQIVAHYLGQATQSHAWR